MEPEPAVCELSAQLRALRSDYREMRIFAREIETRGYHALLGSTAFAGRACEIRDRALRLFDRLAHVLRDVEEARAVRMDLLRTSERLASLFDDGAPAAHARRGGASEFESHGPNLKDLLAAVDGILSPHDGVGLLDRVLSVAGAADGAPRARRPPLG